MSLMRLFTKPPFSTLVSQPLVSRLIQHTNQTVSLPPQQLRKMGMIYSVYRLVISALLFFSSYANSIQASPLVAMPSFLYQIILLFYVVFSILIFALFFVIDRHHQRQLGMGLFFDILVLSLILYISGAPDVQLVMLYMVSVAASFMLLAPYQAAVITLLAVIFVIYQQFFDAIANTLSLTNLGNAILLSISFIGVGFFSWFVSQRLVQVEIIAKQHADKIDKLHLISQRVIANMSQGVVVVDDTFDLFLVNAATIHLLNLQRTSPTPLDTVYHSGLLDNNDKPYLEAIKEHHPQLFNWITNKAFNQPAVFHYEVKQDDFSIVRLRISSTTLGTDSQLISIQDMRREQAGAQQMKLASLGQLTASIAHEIRNPLAAISQASQLLIEDAAQSQDENAELYAMIFNQTKRVNRIIEDVLNLSRQTKSDVSTLNLTDWLPQFISEHFADHDVFLHIDATAEPSARISFDTNQLSQILINLINNGLLYSSQSHPHAYVEIEISHRFNDVILDVLDNGVGVNASHQASLFQPFFTTHVNGTGLGLYLSKAFSEANDAQLVYVPNHEKTCFRLLIPKL